MRRLILTIALLLITNPIFGQETINVWAENFPPYGYKDESGKIVGLSTDVVQHIILDTGIEVGKWIMAPWLRAYYQTQLKPNSLLYTVVGNSERRKEFHLIGPLSDRKQYLYKLRSRKDVVINSIEDAKKYQIGAVSGTAVTELLLSKGLKPYEVPNHDQTIKMLMAGRLDLVIHLDYSLAHIAKTMGVEFSIFEPVLLLDGSKKYYIAINKNSSPTIIEKFRSSFKKLVDTGELGRIQQKYLQ